MGIPITPLLEQEHLPHKYGEIYLIEEFDNPLTDDYKQLKDYVLNSMDMGWYHYSETTQLTSKYRKFDEKDLTFYSHKILQRPDINQGHPYSEIKSRHFHDTYKVIQQIFDHNNTPLNVIYRINFNCTHPQRVNQSPWHRDLEIPHKNFILYMSKFTDGYTYVKKGDEIEKSKTEEDGIIIFDNELHCHAPPKKIGERRIVLVACWL